MFDYYLEHSRILQQQERQIDIHVTIYKAPSTTYKTIEPREYVIFIFCRVTYNGIVSFIWLYVIRFPTSRQYRLFGPCDGCLYCIFSTYSVFDLPVVVVVAFVVSGFLSYCPFSNLPNKVLTSSMIPIS